MKSRRMHITKEFLQIHNLTSNPVDPGGLFDTLWNAATPSTGGTNYLTNALATPFIAGMQATSVSEMLPIETYGAFCVNDAYYCFNGAQSYLTALGRTTDETLGAFLLQKYQSYLTYNQSFVDTWHVRDMNSVIPAPVTSAYSQFEAYIASTLDPIYTLIAMLPCEYLWYNIANPPKNYTQWPPSANNPYQFWVNENNDPTGAYAIGTVINNASSTIDVPTATNIYLQAMSYEVQNFAAAYII